MLKTIDEDIRKHGFHFYIVLGHSCPSFAYSIGLTKALGAELVVAGASFFTGEELKRIVDTVRLSLIAGNSVNSTFSIEELGRFTLRNVHSSWVQPLLLGALDYYKVKDISAYQIVPDEAHRTIDVPNLAQEWSVREQPVWRWLHEPWPYFVSPKSTATTNLAALRGARVTEVTRWEEEEWEMFAGPGPDVTPEQARVVSLGTMLATDPSLVSALDIEIGRGLWRDDVGDWNPWSSGSNEGS